MPKPILAVHNWNTNAQLIEDVQRLGYLNDSQIILDPTYGRGLWWTRFRPPLLIARDRRTHPDWDFCTMSEFADSTFDVVAFDPPYIAQGGRSTIGADVQEFTDRFGLQDCAKTPDTLQHDICLGMTAATRVLRNKGLLMVKCKNYVSSGKLFPATHRTFNHAVNELRLEFIDELTMISGTGPQPSERNGKPARQVHARQNSSTLFVFKKIRRANR